MGLATWSGSHRCITMPAGRLAAHRAAPSRSRLGDLMSIPDQSGTQAATAPLWELCLVGSKNTRNAAVCAPLLHS